MKDKRAAREKRRRREEKAAELRREQDAFFNSLDKKMKDAGRVVKYNRKEAWRMQKELAWELQRETVMTALVAAMYWLNTNMKWGGRKRLLRYVMKVKRCIDILEERNLNQLCEDLRYDADLDIKGLFGNRRYATDRAECVMSNASYGLTAVIWPLYEYYDDWGSRRLKRAAEGISAVMIDAASRKNGINRYIDALEKKTGIRISLDGTTRVVRGGVK